MKKHTEVSSWAEIRHEISKKFSKLSKESLDKLGESWSNLSELVQSTYGMTKEAADAEIRSLKATIHQATADSGRGHGAAKKVPGQSRLTAAHRASAKESREQSRGSH